MKAEHRKELQTNLLADRMGRIIQGVKHRPSRRGLLIGVLLVILGVALLVFLLIWRTNINANSDLWKDYDEVADYKTLATLARDYSSTQQGKSARMEIAYYYLGEGVKTIGRNPSAVEAILAAKELYEVLKDDCKDDPLLGAEALYGIAVAEESLAASSKFDTKEQLDRALKAYQLVSETYQKSAQAVKANKRIEELNDPAERQRIDLFYLTLHVENQNFLGSHGFNQKMFPPKK